MKPNYVIQILSQAIRDPFVYKHGSSCRVVLFWNNEIISWQQLHFLVSSRTSEGNQGEKSVLRHVHALEIRYLGP